MTYDIPDCDCDVGPLDLGSKLLKLSATSAAGFVRQASALISSALPGLGTFRLRRMCEIPETQCPPKSLGTICWQGCNGATLTQTIRLTNTSGSEHVFTLAATPFTEPGGVVAPIALDPNQLTLAGGATGFAKASVKIPDKFPAGHYQTKILVTGVYEQHIDVQLCVCSQQQCTLEVSQGDIPVHIQAHRWYHHFQCVEPCFPPAGKRSSPAADPPRRTQPAGERMKP
jgi:hypothetical protein